MDTIIFILGSVGLAMLSRRSVLNAYSHGLPRFFAFEAILALVVINSPFWFLHPFSLAQIISWVLLICAAILAATSISYLHRFGTPDVTIQDPRRLAFEKTTQVVTDGPYRLIRHPMYASLLFLSGGVFLKHVNLVSAFLVLITCLALCLTARYEEQENLENFGDDYAIYLKTTKRFIPFVF